MMQRHVLGALRVDEIGIETAVLAGLRLRSAFRPVFRRSGDRLEMTAAEVVTIVSGNGLEHARLDLSIFPQPAERQFAIDLCQALHVANYRNLDVPRCDLIVTHDLSRNRQLFEAVEAAKGYAEAAGMDPAVPQRIVCKLGPSAAEMILPDREQALTELHGAGFRILADLFDGSSGIAGLRPAIVKVCGPWTAKIAREPAATALLRQATERHQAAGTRVLVGGIRTPEELNLALGVGADYLAGDLLALPLPAGMAVDRRLLPLAALRRAVQPPGGATVLRFGSTSRR